MSKISINNNRMVSVFMGLAVTGLFGCGYANDIHHTKDVGSQVVSPREGGFRSTVEFGIYFTPESSYYSSRQRRYYNRDTRTYRNYYVSPARAQVMLVQSQLIRLGYYSGSIDGIIGRGTRAGLMAFQLDNGIQPTGRINEITLYRLGILR